MVVVVKETSVYVFVDIWEAVVKNVRITNFSFFHSYLVGGGI